MTDKIAVSREFLTELRDAAQAAADLWNAGLIDGDDTGAVNKALGTLELKAFVLSGLLEDPDPVKQVENHLNKLGIAT